MLSSVERTPPELWQKILDLAADDSTDLYTLGPTTATVFSTTYKKPSKLRENNRSTHTKLSLALVCKAWHYIAMELLFRHLHIINPATLVKLADTLEESRKRSGGKFGNGGWWTKSVFIAVQMTASPDQRDHFIIHARRLIKYCPRLEIVSVSIVSMSGTPNQFMAALKQAAPTLRRIQWLAEGPKIPEFVQLVRACPKLQSLSIPRTFPGNAGQEIPATLCVPTLETLEFNIPKLAGTGCLAPHIPLMAKWDLPSLKNISIRCGSSQHEDLLNFFGAHGLKITFLQFENQIATQGDLLNRILRLCPNLQGLVNRGEVFKPSGPYIHLVRIGVIPSRPEYAAAHIIPILTANDPSILPSLEAIRVLGVSIPGICSLLLETSKRRNIRVEDERGQLLKSLPEHEAIRYMT